MPIHGSIIIPPSFYVNEKIGGFSYIFNGLGTCQTVEIFVVARFIERICSLQDLLCQNQPNELGNYETLGKKTPHKCGNYNAFDSGLGAHLAGM